MHNINMLHPRPIKDPFRFPWPSLMGIVVLYTTLLVSLMWYCSAA